MWPWWVQLIKTNNKHFTNITTNGGTWIHVFFWGAIQRKITTLWTFNLY